MAASVAVPRRSMSLQMLLRAFLPGIVLAGVLLPGRGSVGAAQSEAKPAASSAPTPLPEAAHPPTARETREAQLAADTQKLYALAGQLQAELDKSNKDVLSLAVMRKAAEIEKLAHSISERMKSR